MIGGVPDTDAQGSTSAPPLLEVDGLSIAVPFPDRNRVVVENLSLTVRTGEVVALVGESGSGKTVTALSLMRLLPSGLHVVGGSIRLAGEDVLRMSGARLNEIRGGRVAMLFQQPQTRLDPTATVGAQVAEPLNLHRGLDRRAARSRAIELLREVGIADPRERARGYAHQLSGGMAQRVMIATALSGDPDLLIADEPTTALDVTVQLQILQLLDRQRRDRELAILLITHDLAVVSALAERVAVMYAGRIVEEGPARAILREAHHPYTQALVRSSLLQPGENGTLFSIPGNVAHAGDHGRGCRFRPRCAIADARGIAGRCEEHEPTLSLYGHDRRCRCWAVTPTLPDQSAGHDGSRTR